MHRTERKKLKLKASKPIQIICIAVLSNADFHSETFNRLYQEIVHLVLTEIFQGSDFHLQGRVGIKG